MEAMPLRDMFFWFFLTLFGTGTFVIFEKHVIWGAALIMTGLAGMVCCAWPYIISQQVFAHYLNSRPLLMVIFLIFSLCLFLALAMPELHQQLPGWPGFTVVGIAGAILLCGFWWMTGMIVRPTSPVAPATDAAQEGRPPTLLDLFRNDFPNALKGSDSSDVDAYTIETSNGFTSRVKRQIYEDYEAKTKFIGFYMSRPTPPPKDFSGQSTFAACMKLLKHNAVEETFDRFGKAVAVMSGYGNQMTTSKDLTFSGRVLIYHEEFLPIQSQAGILKAYEAKGLAVTFRGPDYLGTKVMAWHQQHDGKKAH